MVTWFRGMRLGSMSALGVPDACEVGASIRWLAWSLALVLMLLAAGCTSVDKGTPSAKTGDVARLGDCCAKPERYPPALVALADPIAPSVGRMVARMVWREGHLLRHDGTIDQVLTQLRPLDVITVSNKGRLSGHTIPGLFGHAAVYVGTEKQLRQAGVWNHPAVRKHQAAIRKGAMFIEADNKGVHLSTAAAALDADAIAVLRPSGLGESRKREALVGLYQRLGMPFDYWFDLDTTACTFCTELVNTVLPELKLPVRTVYGRRMILPDEVVAATLDGRTRLKFLLYLRSGRETAEFVRRNDLVRDLAGAWSETPGQPSMVARR